MWRVRHSDGTLSDMVNLARAKDAAAATALRVLSIRKSGWEPHPREICDGAAAAEVELRAR
jgi:hypothetical protein